VDPAGSNEQLDLEGLDSSHLALEIRALIVVVGVDGVVLVHGDGDDFKDTLGATTRASSSIALAGAKPVRGAGCVAVAVAVYDDDPVNAYDGNSADLPNAL
jgi:hypothetical protein